MPMSEEEIFDKVKKALVEALSVDDDEVAPEATLTGDLGAESIDYLDIVFRLEKAFDIKIPRGELFPDNLLNDPQYVQDGRLTEAALDQFRQRMPHLDLSEFEKDPDVNKITDLFTVQTIFNYVKGKVN